MKYVLASHSKRRIEYLARIVPDFQSIDSEVDENLSLYFTDNEIAAMKKSSPEQIPLFLSELKCFGVGEFDDDTIVIGADTIVWLSGEVIGKPKDEADAKRILRKLSGKTHAVYTGFTIRRGDKTVSQAVKSLVTFNCLSDGLIDRYVAEAKPLDKAGAYGIQDGYDLVKECEGEADNVLGFPTVEIERAINKLKG